MSDLFEQKGIKPMLIYEMQEPFNSKDWIYELKLDGIRCIAYLDENETDLRNKRNVKLIPRFPELNEINKNVKNKCILDGELVVIKDGVPDFYEVQRRTMLSGSFKIQLANSKFPASFVAYDILYYKDMEVIDKPLIERKKLLDDVVIESKELATSRYFEEKGIELYQIADMKKLEGVVAKKKESKYYFDKRSRDWIKFKRMADEDFVVCGYISKGTNSNTILLGKYKGNQLIYKGSVSFGVRLDFLNEYKCKTIPYSPYSMMPTQDDVITWLEPTLVCVVEYMPNTKNALRQPVFKGIRDDITPLDCQI